jgi:hypothetical protein
MQIVTAADSELEGFPQWLPEFLKVFGRSAHVRPVVVEPETSHGAVVIVCSQSMSLETIVNAFRKASQFVSEDSGARRYHDCRVLQEKLAEAESGQPYVTTEIVGLGRVSITRLPQDYFREIWLRAEIPDLGSFRRIDLREVIREIDTYNYVNFLDEAPTASEVALEMTGVHMP